jgi:hypothetical protein
MKSTQKKDSLESVALALGLLALWALYIVSVAFEYGANELWLNPEEGFFHFRRLCLLALGLAGGWLLHRNSDGFLRLLGADQPKTPWLVLGCLWGVCIGIGSPSTGYTSHGWTLFGMLVWHGVSEEIFFRGFIGTCCNGVVTSPKMAVLLSALIYGFYQWTYVSVAEVYPLSSQAYLWGLSVGCVGWPLQMLTQHARSLLPAFLCRTTAAAVMASGSL